MKIFAIHLIAFLAFLLINNAYGQNLPFNIVACHRDDPNLNDCALNQARPSISLFAQGNISAGYPQLDPLEANEIVTSGNGVNVVLRNLTIVGLADLDLTNLTIDIPTLTFTAKGIVNVTLESLYELSGQYLFIPLTGNGNAHVALYNIQMTYILNHKIVNINGVDYLEIKNDSLTYEIGNAQINLENVFNENQIVGAFINALLNSNPQDVVALFGLPVINYVKEKFKESAEVLYQQVPYDELLIP